ncbi:hypothetical protein PVAP13_9NG081600 [Panicum virgatum]|uniref:Acid phosphatase 1 n=1 Tax=Panicum virgatum TaxID=38727 RepID=A0A8T0MII8_PANVG|nr:hypothetical protein PVAP13_9NG081600 [Panicum virgatum]
MARHRGGGDLVRLLVMLLLAATPLLFPCAAEPEAEVVPTAPSQVPSEEAADAAAQQHLLPRPLVIELPSSSLARVADEGLDDVPADVRCASWRLAAEANNLAPWEAVPAECAAHVRAYLMGSDLGGDGRDAWIFDIDETLLSNLPYYADHGYGLELFDHLEFDKWVERGEAPAIPSSLKLYKEVLELGFKVILLTGRSEGYRGVTVDNLTKQGFHDWDKLILRTASDRKKAATTYNRRRGSKLNQKGTGSWAIQGISGAICLALP